MKRAILFALLLTIGCVHRPLVTCPTPPAPNVEIRYEFVRPVGNCDLYPPIFQGAEIEGPCLSQKEIEMLNKGGADGR